jgi:hypothetical protein
MSETIDRSLLENLPHPAAPDVGKSAVKGAMQDETDAIFDKIAEALEQDRAEGKKHRTIALLSTSIKEDFQRSLADQGDRETLEAKVRERSARRAFRVFRELPGDEASLSKFQQDYQTAEKNADTMERSRLMDLMDTHGDSPVIQTFISVRSTSSHEDSATKLIRTGVVLIEDYGY